MLKDIEMICDTCGVEFMASEASDAAGWYGCPACGSEDTREMEASDRE